MTVPKPKSAKAAPRPKRPPARTAKRSNPPDAELVPLDAGSPEAVAKPPRPKRPSAAKRPARPRGAPPASPSRLSTRTLAIVAAVTLVALPAVVVATFAFAPGGGSGKSIEVNWPTQADSSEAARRLASAGLVRSELLTSIYLRLAGDVGAIEPGTHLLQDDMSPRTLLRRLLRLPGGASVRVTIPEGFNKFDVARRMQDKGVCSARALIEKTTDAALLRDLRLPGPDVEGRLFPATYDFQRNAAPDKVIRRMAIEADKRYAGVFDQNAAAVTELQQAFGWSRQDILALASIVEKEAAVDAERPIIASVFLNRLRDPKFRPERRLQSDPTAVYGCLLQPAVTPTCAQAERGATGPMVRDPLNPYSTYAHAGLPPGPIANPSTRSVEAVLQPATTKYYYFVATGNGRHTFSETYQAHRDAIPPAP